MITLIVLSPQERRITLGSLSEQLPLRFVFVSDTNLTVCLQLAVDLLHPTPASERRKHKLKRLVPHPNSYFMDVKCPGCYKITTVFSHAQRVVVCAGCSTILCQPTGGRARLTEGKSIGQGGILVILLIYCALSFLWVNKSSKLVANDKNEIGRYLLCGILQFYDYVVVELMISLI